MSSKFGKGAVEVDGKEAAARQAVTLIEDGMVIGLGTGTTSAYMLQALGERIAQEGLRVRGVPTSVGSREMADQYHIPLVDLSDVVTIDGADEVDGALHLIKGGGGALVREKIVAAASRTFVVICDDSKIKPFLGAHPLPVAVVPFGVESTRQKLRRFTETVVLRPSADAKTPFVTDDGLYILDMHLGTIRDVPALEASLRSVVGVVEVGLFVQMASRVIVGYADGHTKELLPSMLR